MDKQNTKTPLSRQNNTQEKRTYEPAILYKLDELPEGKNSPTTFEFTADNGPAS